MTFRIRHFGSRPNLKHQREDAVEAGLCLLGVNFGE